MNSSDRGIQEYKRCEDRVDDTHSEIMCLQRVDAFEYV